MFESKQNVVYQQSKWSPWSAVAAAAHQIRKWCPADRHQNKQDHRLHHHQPLQIQCGINISHRNCIGGKVELITRFAAVFEALNLFESIALQHLVMKRYHGRLPVRRDTSVFVLAAWQKATTIDHIGVGCFSKGGATIILVLIACSRGTPQCGPEAIIKPACRVCLIF